MKFIKSELSTYDFNQSSKVNKMAFSFKGLQLILNAKIASISSTKIYTDQYLPQHNLVKKIFHNSA
jgi:hypothetical protein